MSKKQGAQGVSLPGEECIWRSRAHLSLALAKAALAELFGCHDKEDVVAVMVPVLLQAELIVDLDDHDVRRATFDAEQTVLVRGALDGRVECILEVLVLTLLVNRGQGVSPPVLLALLDLLALVAPGGPP